MTELTLEDPERANLLAIILYRLLSQVEEPLPYTSYLVQCGSMKARALLDPHFYTREESMDAVIDEISSIREGGPDSWLHLKAGDGAKY